MTSNPVAEYDYLFKVILIGDSSVGKSCTVLMFSDSSFTDSYISTIGVDFKIRTEDIDDKMIKLQIWDTAGQERFRTITSSYYRGCHGAVIVYDVTDPESFRNVDHWVQEIERYGPPHITRMLIGNKCDLKEKRLISKQEGEEKAKEHGMLFLETSAKANINIREIFFNLARQIRDDIMKTPLAPGVKRPSPTPGKPLPPGTETSKSCCY